MGLDQYIFRVKKPNLEDRVYTHEELGNLCLHSAYLKDVAEAPELIEQLIPYAVVRNVEAQFINKAKIIEDYNLPDNAYISYMSSVEVKYRGKDNDGNDISVTIDYNEIEKKYIATEILPCYVWDAEEIQYWRKEYDLQDWIYQNINNVQNTGYYILNAEMIRELNSLFDEHLPKEDPDDESALFYWEWY
jgi:hypothetical protein